jgi:hypothetical protein
VYEKDQSADPVKVADPWEGHEADGADVVDEHLPEVLPLHVSELRGSQRPVERQRDHVVPPRASSYTLKHYLNILVYNFR